MTATMLLAVVAWVAFAVTAPRLARRLPPAAATRALTAGAVVIAASSVVMIATVAAPWIAQLPEIDDLGYWSPAKLRSDSQVPVAAAVACALLVFVALGRLAVTTWRRVKAMAEVHRCCQHLPSAAADVVVVDSEHPDAFATPLPGGRIVVTTGLLRALSADERRALFAHERSHIAHRHAWWVLATDLAAASNPLLVPSARAVRRAVERWADEDAAHVVGDRVLTARTVARVALLIKDSQPVPATAATGGDVPHRVRALMAAPPRRRLLPVLGMVTMLLLSVSAGISVHERTDTVFDRASVNHRTHDHDHGDR
jgi:Zn-dependent protease with chaperone function